MEGKFESGSHAELAIIGQPNTDARKLENPIVVPYILSYLAYGSFGSTVYGLNDFPQDRLPDNIELLYYGYHIMAGLGTIMIGITGLSVLLLWNKKLFVNRSMLWLLMLAFPLPYIATTAGWLVAELGRQPWVVYGLLRTADGTSPLVHAGNVAFSTLGFMGLYLVIGILFVFLVYKEIKGGPLGHDVGAVRTH
jgi:cytochrome d ubiquinol oxidase subunit I